MVQIVMFLHILACITANIAVAVTQTCCEDGYNLSYTLPMFELCGDKEHPEKGLLPTIPKLIPSSFHTECNQRDSAIPRGKRICRFSDCLNKPCKNGRCVDTMTGFKCLCRAEFTGERCETRLNDYTTENPFKTTSENPFKTTSENPVHTTSENPVHTTSENPVHTTSSTGLNNHTTENPFRTTSESPFKTTSENPLHTTPSTDSNWECESSKCYYLDIDRSRQEAENFCTNRPLVETKSGLKDPSLLFVDNDPDFEAIERLFKLSKKVWINCEYKRTGDELTCDVDGTGRTSHMKSNWETQEPRNVGEHGCVAVALVSEKWTNNDCNVKYHTICQILL